MLNSIKGLLDRWHDRDTYFPESLVITILRNRGLSSHLEIFNRLKTRQWPIRRPETVKKHLDRMVFEGKLQSRKTNRFTYYEIVRNNEIS
jgi:hypothetical protein